MPACPKGSTYIPKMIVKKKKKRELKKKSNFVSVEKEDPKYLKLNLNIYTLRYKIWKIEGL